MYVFYVFFFTLCLSFIDPRPNTAILHIVSSCSLLRELPFGPNSFPTKLNCNLKVELDKGILFSLDILVKGILFSLDIVESDNNWFYLCKTFGLYLKIMNPETINRHKGRN